MMTCVIIVAFGFICADAPKSTSAQAADVLRDHQYVAVPKGNGPTFVIIPSTPGALGWLAFPPSTPARRLDGTLLSQPVTIYGVVRSRHHRR